MADDTRYAYAVARVRGMETGLLDRQWLERLLSESADGALKALSDSAYEDSMADVGRPQEVERGLILALGETLETISGISPVPELIDLFRLRWDARNLKALQKASFLKLEGEIGTASGVGTIEVSVLEKAVEEKDYTTLPDFLAEAARTAEESYRDRGELSAIDAVIDRATWKHSLDVAAAHRDAFLCGFFQVEIDLANVKSFARVKEANGDRADLAAVFVPGGTLELSLFEGLLGEPMDAFAHALEYGTYGALTPVFREWTPERIYILELVCDNVLLKEIEKAKTIAYGIEPLVAFIVYRQIEIKLIRTAVIAKLDGVERSDVEARLRMTHV